MKPYHIIMICIITLMAITGCAKKHYTVNHDDHNIIENSDKSFRDLDHEIDQKK